MLHPKNLSIAQYTYVLPDERIAFQPLPQRDAAKLLVYKNQSIEESSFQQLTDFLPTQSLVVFNQTKVLHARLWLYTQTGVRIEIFCLAPAQKNLEISLALLQKGNVQWQCMIGRKAKWKPNEVLRLELGQLVLEAERANEKSDIVTLSWQPALLTFAEVLHRAGKVPLPPYIKRAAVKTDEDRYQTVFAKEEGSVAAPTASLHFTSEVLESFKVKKIETALVTLHVGAGTFLPVKAEKMEGHNMHEEWIEVNQMLIEQLLHQKDKPIIAAGTTTLRTLESLYWLGVRLLQNNFIIEDNPLIEQWLPYERQGNFTKEQVLEALLQHYFHPSKNTLHLRTKIIIAPGYQLKMADALITNFHQPGSTLLLLVAAVVSDDWKVIYNYALQNNFRFLSYGDSSLLWKEN